MGLLSAGGATAVIFALLAAIALGFILRFILPAIRLNLVLGSAVQRLERLLAEGQRPEPTLIADEVMAAPRLAHLWREYAQTLHPTDRDDGLRTWRATVMAEGIFSEAALVDTPLKTEFYKHLPGILTGIGIIGTFAGLIAGLTQFEVSSDAATVRLSLRTLIQGVGHAFQVSALAIALAMLATWIEKSLVTLAYRKVARLNELIDSLFEGGVEEEYLARLVRASELSAEQVAQLRQQLGQSKEEQAAGQQAMIAEAVGQAVAAAVDRALREPMQRIADAVERAGGNQGEAAARSLGPLLERFTARMEASLGHSQSGLEATLARTVEALGKVVQELGRVSGRLETSGQGMVQSAAGQLQSAGQGVGRAADTFAQASGQLVGAAASLTAAAMEASSVMREQAQTRDAFAAMLVEMRGLLETSRREAAVSDQLIGRIEGAAAALGRAEIQARDYLDGVSRVLGEAHSSFADNIERTLRQGNSQFHKELATAVDYLKGAIEELGDTLETLVARR